MKIACRIFRSDRRAAAAVAVLAALLSVHADAGPGQEADGEEMAADYKEDLAAFRRLRNNLMQLSGDAARRSDLFGPRPDNDPMLLRPDMRMQVLALWYPVLDCYMALDTLAEPYTGFYLFKKDSEREKAFHLAWGIFLTQYRAALELITVFEQNRSIDTILNEGDASLGLPRGVYAQFKYQYLNVAKAGRYAALEAVARAYPPAADPGLADWADADSRVILDAGKGPGPRMTFKNGLSIIERFGRSAWLPVQKGVAEWMGHTKVWRPRQNWIRPEQVRELSLLLEPGDILLERREWYLTNVGIPGFWTHAALYVGNSAERNAVSEQPEVRAWLNAHGAGSIDGLIAERYPGAYAALQAPFKDGLPPRVIEAISTGVTLTSLDFSAACDSLAVLRPRLSKVQRAAAVVAAMRYHGRPYDYDFDFTSDAGLVCTELVVKSYLPAPSNPGLSLPLEKVMGKPVTPANAFARHFDSTFGRADQQMDLVIFLDGFEKEKRAVRSDVDSFRASWNRPKWHILVQDAPGGR